MGGTAGRRSAPAGAWHINLTRHVSSRSDDLLRLYGTRADKWRNEHDLAELFAYQRLTTNADEAKALALIVNATEGAEHLATWTVNRDDGERRAVHFACRCVEVKTPGGRVELIVRGITHDIGPAESVPAAPPPTPVLLAQQVLAAEATPGRWRAIVDLRTMRLLKWLDNPMPGIAWTLGAPHRPAVPRAVSNSGWRSAPARPVRRTPRSGLDRRPTWPQRPDAHGCRVRRHGRRAPPSGPFESESGPRSCPESPNADRYDLVLVAAEPHTFDWFRPADWADRLTPAGVLVVITRGARSGGRFVDPAGQLVRAAHDAGLRYVDRIALLRVPVRDVLRTSATAAGTPGAPSPVRLATPIRHSEVHDDLLVFGRPTDSAGAAASGGDRR